MALRNDFNFSPDACRILEVYDDGIIHLHFRELELRIRFWPEPFAEGRENTSAHWKAGDAYAAQLLNHWLNLRPTSKPAEQGIFLFDLYTEDRNPIWSLERIAEWSIRRIPLAVRHFLKHTEGLPWPLLQLAGSSHEVLDLAQSNPMLFKLWLDHENAPISHFGQATLTNLRKPQPLQLKLLQLPSEPWWAKLLRKIPLEETPYLSLPDFQMLEASTDPRHTQYLQHCHRISAYEIKAVSGAVCLDHLIQKCGDGDLKPIMCLILNALGTIPKPGGLKLTKFLKKFLRKAEQLAFESYTPRQRIRLKNWKSVLPFRCPTGWRHLDTVDKIIREGNEQKNCLREPHAYLEDNIYLFKITRPIRATACVKCEDLGKLTLTECAGAKNADIGWADMLKIRMALNDAKDEHRPDHPRPSLSHPRL